MCTTCSHTLQKIGDGIWWCPRCGTIVDQFQEHHAPVLVERCRQFQESLGPSWLGLWKRMGLNESIYSESER